MSPLFIRRKYELILTVHKILKAHMPPLTPDIYVKDESDYCFRNSVRLQQPKYKTVMYGYNAIRYQGASLWNRLPDVFKVDDFNDFKCKLKDYNLKCECGDCFNCSLKCL